MSDKPSILVVDDSSDSREMLTEYLVFTGFSVSDASNGREAIEVARRVRPHVILMDLSMPVMDGWEATRQLKADAVTKDIIIIAVTAHAFEAERESAREAGCDALIAKPFDLCLLASALNRVVGKGLSAFDAVRVDLEPAAPKAGLRIVETEIDPLPVAPLPAKGRRTAARPATVVVAAVANDTRPSKKKFTSRLRSRGTTD